MPHLIGLMVIGAGLYAGYRAFMRAAERVTDDFRRAEAEVRIRTREKNMGSLEYDPIHGVYRPRNDR